MGSKKTKFKIEWENNVSFEFSLKPDNEDYLSIVELHENTCIAETVGPLRQLCLNVFIQYLDKALKEMEKS